MPVYLYKARTSEGEPAGGEITADDRRSALQELAAQELHVTALRELNQPAGADPAHPQAPGLASLTTYVSPAKRAFFWRQAAQAQSAGFGIGEVLLMVGEGARGALAQFALRARDEASRGSQLSALMQAEPALFGPLEVGLIRAGEVGGSLEDQMKRLARYFEREVALRQSIQFRLYWLGCTGVVMVLSAFSVSVVAPALMYRETHPVGAALLKNGLTFCLPFVILGAVLFGLRAGYATVGRLRLGVDRAKVVTPIVGGLFRKLAVARYCNALGQLVGAGVPAGEAAELAAGASGNLAMAARLAQLGRPLRDGVPLSEALRSTGEFPHQVIQMVATGEKTGSIDQMLDKLSHYYEGEVEASTKTLMNVGYAVAIIVAGAFVLVFLASSYTGMVNSWLDFF